MFQIISGICYGILSQPGIVKSITEHPAAAVYFITIGFNFGFMYYMVYAAGATGRNKMLWGFLASGIRLIAFLILQDRIVKEKPIGKEEEISKVGSEKDSFGNGDVEGGNSS